MFRRKNDNNGSIIFNERRFNDGFSFNTKGVSNKYGFSSNDLTHINYTSNWSIAFSFSLNVDVTTRRIILDKFVTSSGGWTLQIINNELNFQGGSNQTISTTLNKEVKYSVVLVFDSITKELETYINGSLNKTTVIASFTDTNKVGGVNYFTTTSFTLYDGIDALFDYLGTFNDKITQRNINYLYLNGVVPHGLDSICETWVVSNALVGETNTRNYLKTTFVNGWDSGVIFSDHLSAGTGSFEFKIANDEGNIFIGLCNATTPILPGDWSYTTKGVYGFYLSTSNRLYPVQNSSFGSQIATRNKGDILRIDVSGGIMTLFQNGLSIGATYGIPANAVKPSIFVFEGNLATATDLKLDGVSISGVEDSFQIKVDGLVLIDTIETINSTKEAKHVSLINYDNDELGLNIGTSTFTAYADYYTRILGENFSGGGDSVIYKGKELRKYGLKFNGIDQYLSVPFNLVKDKGYTIEIAFTMPTNVAFASTQPILSKRDGATNYIEVLGDSTKKTLSLKYIDTGAEVGVGNVNTAQDISKMQYSVMRVSPNQDVYLKESIATYEKVYANNQIQCIQWNAVTGQTEGINPFDEITVGFDDITGNLNIGYDGTNYFGGTLFAVRIWEGLLDVGENQINRNNGILRNANDVTYSSKSNLKLDIDFNNPYDSGGLKLNDTSPNAAVLDAFGWANLSAIEAAREEILSKF